MKKIDRVKKRFIEEGLEIALCGHPKEREYVRKAVELEYVDSISHETVRRV
jgi:uncharacterized pyridoxamine 5'-phosphate oxidase family protein